MEFTLATLHMCELCISFLQCFVILEKVFYCRNLTTANQPFIPKLFFQITSHGVPLMRRGKLPSKNSIFYLQCFCSYVFRPDGQKICSKGKPDVVDCVNDPAVRLAVRTYFSNFLPVCHKYSYLLTLPHTFSQTNYFMVF